VSPSNRVSSAGLLLAAALFVHALPWPGPEPEPCVRPSESAASGGHTIEVACDAIERPARPLRGPSRRLFGLPIDVNRADASTLASLPGIGPARANAILAARAERPFRSVADLERASGIGPVLLGRLRDHVTARPLAAGLGSR
jgi:competence ComEA-like helix-hairpin-helix protein